MEGIVRELRMIRNCLLGWATADRVRAAKDPGDGLRVSRRGRVEAGGDLALALEAIEMVIARFAGDQLFGELEQTNLSLVGERVARAGALAGISLHAPTLVASTGGCSGASAGPVGLV